ALTDELRLLDRATDHSSEFFDQAVGNTAGARQIVLTFELLNRCACSVVQCSGCFDLTVAEFRQGTLHGDDPRRGTDQFGDRIIAPGHNWLRDGRCGNRARGWAGYDRLE